MTRNAIPGCTRGVAREGWRDQLLLQFENRRSENFALQNDIALRNCPSIERLSDGKQAGTFCE
jgi:hypothetical protein